MKRFLAAAGLAATSFLLVQCDRETPATEGPAATTAEKRARPASRASRDEEEPDPKAALRRAFDEAQAAADPTAREKALEAVAWDGIDVDPDLAREAFAALTPGGTAAKRLVGHFAMRLADDDPEAALAWARDLEETGEREEALGRIAVVVSAGDAVRAATLVAEELPPGRLRDRTVVQVVQRWAQAEPAEAAGWLATFPAGGVRSDGLTAVATSWLAADPAGYEAWALGVDGEELRAEAADSAAAALRALPAAAREKPLAAFRDAAFREQVEGLLEE